MRMLAHRVAEGATYKMTQILVTGATGVLGQQVVKALANLPSVIVRLMSRRVLDPGGSGIDLQPYSRVSSRRLSGYGPPTDRGKVSTVFSFPAASWVRADLKSGEGLLDAVRDID